jgi:hypothetical protein
MNNPPNSPSLPRDAEQRKQKPALFVNPLALWTPIGFVDTHVPERVTHRPPAVGIAVAVTLPLPSSREKKTGSWTPTEALVCGHPPFGAIRGHPTGAVRGHPTVGASDASAGLRLRPGPVAQSVREIPPISPRCRLPLAFARKLRRARRASRFDLAFAAEVPRKRVRYEPTVFRGATNTRSRRRETSRQSHRLLPTRAGGVLAGSLFEYLLYQLHHGARCKAELFHRHLARC